MKLSIPEMSLVVFIGPSGCGKTTFGREHFAPFEVVSSDFCRGLVGNSETNQAVTGVAFDLLYEIVRRRLALGLLTVVDATNVRREDRAGYVRIAREFHVLPVAVVFDDVTNGYEKPIIRPARCERRDGLAGQMIGKSMSMEIGNHSQKRLRLNLSNWNTPS